MTPRARSIQTPKRDPLPRPVLIVSRNEDTIDGLQSYLSAAAIVTRSALAVEELVQRLSSGSALCCIFFPDDYAGDQIEATIEAIRGASAGSTVVLVTRSPQRFDGFFEGRDVRVILLAKPAWGWTIRDAILGRMPDSGGSAAGS